MRGRVPLFGAACRLVQAVRDGDRAICNDKDPLLQPLVVELHHFCGRSKDVLDAARARGERSAAERASRYYVAEAHYRLGNLQEAERLFRAVEDDPVLRSSHPVATLFALERLSAIADKRGRAKDARGGDELLVRLWGNIDIPLPELERARRRLSVPVSR